MKHLAVSHAFLLASLSLMTLPRPARATVAWSANHERGDLSEWTLGPNPTKTLPGGVVRKNVEVLGEQVYSGNYACKITVHPDDTFGQYNQDRVDIQHTSTLTAEGKDSYLSGYYYLPEDAKTRNDIFFEETKVSFRNWMDLWVEPKAGGGTTVKFGIESNGANLGSVLLWTGTWTIKEWHQFAIHVHWSTNPQLGVVDVWFDGQQVITGHKHNTKFDTNVMFFNVGMHRVLPQNFVETIYFDDFIEADTLEEAKIAPPRPGGSDGGVTDAGGRADSGGTGGAGGAGSGAGGSGGAGSGGSGGASSGTAGTGGGAGASSGSGGEAGASGSATGAGGSGGTGSVGSSGTSSSASSTTGSAGTSGAAVTSAATTGGAAPADAPGGCACVIAETRSSALRWDSAGVLFGALVLAYRRRRRALGAR